MAEVRVMRHGRVVQIPTQAPMVLEIGVRGMPGGRGEKGEKGDALSFEDLTPAQKEELKGEKGDSAQVEPIAASVIDNLF